MRWTRGALDFLAKPFGSDRFDRAVNRALEKLHLLEQRPVNEQAVFAKLPNIDRSAIYPIRWDEIVYVRSHSKVTTVFRSDGRVFQCAYLLRRIEEMAPPHIVRIHRSFLLNINEVEYYSCRLSDRKVCIKAVYHAFWQDGEANEIEMKGEKDGELPVGDVYYARLANVLQLDV